MCNGPHLPASRTVSPYVLCNTQHLAIFLKVFVTDCHLHVLMPGKYDVHGDEGPKDNRKFKFEESGDVV